MVQVEKSLNNEIFTFTDTSNLCEDISSLYNNEKFSDIILVYDNQRFHAHKAILAVRCQYFASLLFADSDALQNEIIIPDVSILVFEYLLTYVYTGSIAISSDVPLILQVLELAHKYSLTSLQTGMVKKLKTVLTLQNICSVLNTANLYDLDELRDHCYSFIEHGDNASRVISGDCFSDLTQKSVVKLLERDTLMILEIEIFKSVVKWIKINNDVDDLVIQCVRLSSFSVIELMSIVWPLKLVDCEKLLQAIAEVVGVKPRLISPRAILLKDENIATPEHGAELVSGSNTSKLYAYHTIGDKTGIVIKLGYPFCFNHINMVLYDGHLRYYSYYVEVSLDREYWRKIIDYSSFACRSHQKLYFDQHIARYIRIVGTSNTADGDFHLLSFELYFKSNLPKTVNGTICPKINVATPDKKALVVEGPYNPNALLNGDYLNYDGTLGYTSHTIGVNHIMIHLAQPYLISSMKLLLWDKDARKYRYYIETSINKNDWEIAVDRRNVDCQSWQDLTFTERVVVFIRITGTYGSANNVIEISEAKNSIQLFVNHKSFSRISTVFILSVHLNIIIVDYSSIEICGINLLFFGNEV